MVSVLVANLLYTVVSNTIYYLTYLTQIRRSDGTVLRLYISIFSTSAFKPAKFGFAVELDISITVRPFTSAFIRELDRSNRTFTFQPRCSVF